MNEHFINMEELEQFDCGEQYGAQTTGEVIADGIVYVGGKALDGVRWLWNGITNIL